MDERLKFVATRPGHSPVLRTASQRTLVYRLQRRVSAGQPPVLLHGSLESLNSPWRNLPKVRGRRVRYLSLGKTELTALLQNHGGCGQSL
jgi:hypothetical protein